MSGKILSVLAAGILLSQSSLFAASDSEKQLRRIIEELQRENAGLVAELHAQNAALSKSGKVDPGLKQRLGRKAAAGKSEKKVKTTVSAEKDTAAAAAAEEAILYKELGQGYLKEKQFEQAINAFEKALSFDHDDAAVCYDLGLLYKHQRNDNKKAAAYLKRYLTLAPLARDAEDVKYLIRMLEYSGTSYP
ncbi:MAG: tetratricopeptide repeat protein [Elusimicrobia bacterium]|nr:tetratricopeptide repeat protein [Elusimicrobiota bacterium]